MISQIKKLWFLDDLAVNSAKTHVVSTYSEKEISSEEFLSSVHKLSDSISKVESDRWLLYCDNSYLFLVACWSLVCTGKTIVMLPNVQAGTLSEMIGEYDAVLTDVELPQSKKSIVISRDCFLDSSRLSNSRGIVYSDVDLVFYTSGSTGKPKKVVKKLSNILSEVIVLNKCWGKKVAQSVFLSTVSHQHIYGLLFRVLWPFCFKNIFFAERQEFPEQINEVMKKTKKCTLVSSPAHLSRIGDVLSKPLMSDVMQMVFSSGGPLSESTSYYYYTQFSICPMEILGSTETGGVAMRQVFPNNKSGLWNLLPEVKAHSEKETQQLLVQSPFIYMADNPFLMGDKVDFVNTDQFKLLGRADRVVKIEEKRVSLQEIEDKLTSSNLVKECRAILVRRHLRSQSDNAINAIGCVLVLSTLGERQLKNGKLKLINQLKALLLGHFESVVLPRKWRIVDSLPINQQGKVTNERLVRLFER
ncbi:AMP-binding protein [Pleionea sediminis]|uniref:AMP-binding protein n=1 Tax=Pleionea sediminis TaxID=2569479 RepID=UPI001185AA9D|nr:AMP-binding protein [Pleionea sediminis]